MSNAPDQQRLDEARVGLDEAAFAVRAEDADQLKWGTLTGTAVRYVAAREEFVAAVTTPLLAALEQERERLRELREAVKKYAYPVEHYGEPEGLSNCPVNPYGDPSSDEEIGPNGGGYWRDGVRPECDCGADEANAALKPLLSELAASEEAQ